MTGQLLAQRLTAVTHVLRVRHTLSDRPVPGLRAQLIAPTPWWVKSRVTPGGEVVVFSSDNHPPPGNPRLRVWIEQPAVAALITSPDVELDLTSPSTLHEFLPVPQRLTIVVTNSSNGDAGKPVVGVPVHAVPAAGAPVPLQEDLNEPGTYHSALRTWTTGEATFEVDVDGVVVEPIKGKPGNGFCLDAFRITTRLHVVVAA